MAYCLLCSNSIQGGHYCGSCFDKQLSTSPSKVLSLVDKLPKQHTAEETLLQALYNVKEDPGSHFFKANKMLVISLFDKDESYNVDYISTEMKLSEVIALLEIFKNKILVDMQVK